MSSLLTNWKTTLAGVILILVGGLGALVGIHIPGFTMESGAAITMGIGLLVAKDAGPAVKALLFAFALSSLMVFGGSTVVHAADVANKANPFSSPYDLTKAGAYFGAGIGGSESTVNGTNVIPGTQIVQGSIFGTVGYGAPINAATGSFWFAEAQFGIQNLNGNTNGLSYLCGLFSCDLPAIQISNRIGFTL